MSLASFFVLSSATAAAPIDVPWWAWAGFLAFISLMLALDLGVFHKEDKVLPFKEAISWCAVWVSLAAAFGGLIWW